MFYFRKRWTKPQTKVKENAWHFNEKNYMFVDFQSQPNLVSYQLKNAWH